MEVCRIRAIRVESQEVVIGEADGTDGMEVFMIRAIRIESQQVVIRNLMWKPWNRYMCSTSQNHFMDFTFGREFGKGIWDSLNSGNHGIDICTVLVSLMEEVAE